MKYGVIFNGQNSAGTRTYNAVGKSWTRSSDLVAGQDDFNNFGIKECITDYNSITGEREVLAYKGDSNWDTLVANKTGDRMLEIPLFFYSRPSKYEFVISDTLEAGFKPSPMHYHNGVLFSTMRISKYALSNTYTSQTGELPRISTNMNTFRTNLLAKGQYLMDYPTWCSLVMLMLVKYANMDVQATVGMGRNSGRAVITSGVTDNVLGVDGSATDLTTNESVLTLGIENFYSNVFKFVDGLYAYDANLYVKDVADMLTDPADSTELVSSYNLVSTAIPQSGASANIGDIAYDNIYDWMLFPTVSGTPNASGDRYFSNKNFNCLVTGGSAWLGAADGLFFFMVLAVGSTGTGGGALAIEFGDIVKEGDYMTDISFGNLAEYDGRLRQDVNLLKRSTAYSLNSVVNKGQIYLKCTTAGTTSLTTLSLSSVDVGDTLTDGTVVWEVISVTGVNFNSSGKGLDFYTVGEDYSVGDIVIYGGNIYQCTIAHTATSIFDTTKWAEVSASENGISEWQSSTDYEIDDIVIYQDCIYRCDTAHTSTSTFDDTKFTQLTYELETDSNLVEDIFGGVVL